MIRSFRSKSLRKFALGLRFHTLKGEGKGRYAVDASGNWRITFGWDGEDAIEVDLKDYH